MTEERKPIKLYVGPDYVEPTLFTYTELLFPFWGVSAKESMPYVRAAALQYQYSKDDFSLVDTIQEADYVLMPYQYDRLLKANPERAQKIIAEAREAGKTLIIDASSDIEHPIHIPNTILFRISQYRYSIQPNEITVPFPAEDLLEVYAGGELRPREKNERPTVGFTGWASVSFLSRIKLYIKELPILTAALFDRKRFAEHKGIFFRQRALHALEASSRVETKFTARPTYSGHVATITGSVADNRAQFVDTLRTSDYALCVKGDANASVRFFEALSLGCIPLFVDTACVLPLEDRINYRDFCVYVDWRDLHRIGDIIADFHTKCTPERFKEMQMMARETYKTHLRMDAFSRDLAGLLRKRLS